MSILPIYFGYYTVSDWNKVIRAWPQGRNVGVRPILSLFLITSWVNCRFNLFNLILCTILLIIRSLFIFFRALCYLVLSGIKVLRLLIYISFLTQWLAFCWLVIVSIHSMVGFLFRYARAPVKSTHLSTGTQNQQHLSVDHMIWQSN